MREEVEMLENHSDIFSDQIDICFWICKVVVIYSNLTFCNLFEEVETPKESRFTRTGRSDNTDHIPFVEFRGDSF